jgi:hypothetical protein
MVMLWTAAKLLGSARLVNGLIVGRRSDFSHYPWFVNKETISLVIANHCHVNEEVNTHEFPHLRSILMDDEVKLSS